MNSSLGIAANRVLVNRIRYASIHYASNFPTGYSSAAYNFNFPTVIRQASHVTMSCSSFQKAVQQETYGHLLDRASYGQSDQISRTTIEKRRFASSDELFKCVESSHFSSTDLLHCKACSRSEAYTVLFVRKGKAILRTTHLRHFILTESTISLLWYSW